MIPHLLPFPSLFYASTVCSINFLLAKLKEILSNIGGLTSLSKRVEAWTPQPYKPCLHDLVDHWCIHAGGKGIIDGVQKGLNLKEEDVKASRSVLYERGNLASSSVFYELDYHLKHSTLEQFFLFFLSFLFHF